MKKVNKNIIWIMIGIMAIFLVGCANISTSVNETSVVKNSENLESTTKVSYTTNAQLTKEVVTTKKTTTMEMVTTEQTTEKEVKVTTRTAYVVEAKPLETTSTTSNSSNVESNPNSEDEMINNGSFYCVYTVQPNDTYLKLWNYYQVTQKQICAFNGIDPNAYLTAGWIIYIPLDTYIPPDTWEYDYTPVFDSNTLNDQNQNNEFDNSNLEENDNIQYDDGLVWSNSVTLYTTNSESASWHNILQASNMLNGFKLGPGETFDWFINMGPCSYDQGFIDAGAYVEGGSAPGGGICFVSTALMQAARGSNCNNMLYYDHINPVSYASRGNEAAVSYGECDLVFSNPSQTTGLQFWVVADEASHSITVSSNIYY